jgi:hypothetical protein
MNHDQSNIGENPTQSDGSIDPKEFVRQNRRKIIAIIRSSDDQFMRAYAWALLDKYTSNTDGSELHQELDEIIKQED